MFWTERKYGYLSILILLYVLFNDTRMEELVLYWKNSLKYKVIASDVFHMFTRSIKLFQLHYRTDSWLIE